MDEKEIEEKRDKVNEMDESLLTTSQEIEEKRDKYIKAALKASELKKKKNELENEVEAALMERDEAEWEYWKALDKALK